MVLAGCGGRSGGNSVSDNISDYVRVTLSRPIGLDRGGEIHTHFPLEADTSVKYIQRSYHGYGITEVVTFQGSPNRYPIEYIGVRCNGFGQVTGIQSINATAEYGGKTISGPIGYRII